MDIRKATIKDLKEIQKLNLALFRKEYNEFDKTLDCDGLLVRKELNLLKRELRTMKIVMHMLLLKMRKL